MIFIRYHLNFLIVVIALFRKWSNSDRGWLVVVGDMDGKLKTHGSGPLSISFKEHRLDGHSLSIAVGPFFSSSR
jgi:hypothetical protein